VKGCVDENIKDIENSANTYKVLNERLKTEYNDLSLEAIDKMYEQDIEELNLNKNIQSKKDSEETSFRFFYPDGDVYNRDDEFFIEKPPNALFDEKDDISSTSTSKKELTKNISGVRIYMSSISYQEKYGKNGNLHDENLISCIIFNFKELHPLWSFFRVSIISPLILRSWFFIFNTLILFGFNALIYWEGLIEKRIYDKKRNRFDYPMRKEFGKILLCILLQIVVTGLIKLLVFVFPEQKRTLEGGLKNFEIKLGREADNNIIVRIDQLEKEMFIRRLIGGVLMLFIVIFFFLLFSCILWNLY